MHALNEHLQRENTKDLCYTLQVPENKPWGWKRACNPLWMAKLNFLAHGLILVAPNAVVASVKLKLAIQKLLNEHKCTTSKGHAVADTVDLCDQMIRMLLGQFRSCKDNPETYYRICRKMSAAEKLELDRTLAAMDSNTEQATAVPKGASAENRMVLWQPPQAPAAAAGTGSIFKRILSKQDSETSAPAAAAGTGSIFKRILSKQDSETSVEPSQLPSQPSSSSKPLESMVPLQSSSSSKPFLGMVAGEPCSPSDFSSVAPTPPKKRKSLKGHKEDEKPAAVGRTAKDFLSSSEEDLQTVLTEEVSRSKVPLKKKPAASTKGIQSAKPSPSPKKEVAGCAKKRPASKATAKSSASKPKLKCSFKHRKTASAYSSARALALKQGKSPEEAKKCGQEALAKMSALIDAGVVKENM
eukprot:Skav204492  [mRNA]  locus=scaffold2305:1578:2896:- [translate_table: standard]